MAGSCGKRFVSAVRSWCADIVLGVTCLGASTAAATTWNVFQDGSGDAPTIDAAADSASSGDSIVVWPGTYIEEVELHTDVVLRGEGGAATTTVDAGGASYCVWTSEELLGSVIGGFTFIGAQSTSYGSEGYAVRGRGRLAIEDCDIGGAGFEMGVVLWECGPLSLRNLDVAVLGNQAEATVDFFGGTPPADSLTVEDCAFEGNGNVGATIGLHGRISCVIRNCEFKRGRGDFMGPAIGYSTVGTSQSIVLEGSLFVENKSAAIGLYSAPIRQGYNSGMGSNPVVVVRGNTFARNTEAPFGNGFPAVQLTGVFEQNIMTGGPVGLWLPNGGTGFTTLCNDSFGNGQNWSGIPDLTGVDGNISEPPLYCDTVNEDFTLASDSPCLSQNNSCNVQMGAFGQGCGPTQVESVSWGRLKGAYR